MCHRLELLAQHEVSLTNTHRLAGLLADVVRQLEDLMAIGQARNNQVEARDKRDCFQDFLFLAGRQVQKPGDEISERSRLFG
jgi:hypothetical protein